MVESSKCVVEDASDNSTTHGVPEGYGAAGRASSTSRESGRQGACATGNVVGGDGVFNKETTISTISYQNKREEEGCVAAEERGYAEFKALFPCSPGPKEGETHEAYRSLIERGFTEKQLRRGAERAIQTSSSDSPRFPLTFLRAEPEELTRRCGKPRRADRTKLKRVEKRWWYPVPGDSNYVDCDPDASEDAALAAVNLRLEAANGGGEPEP